MDDEEIAVSILSLTAPGIEGWQGAERIDIARRINDYGAELVRAHPDRFGYLATLALPDVDAGLVELARALDDLGADGIVLHSNFDGIYLGDNAFEPVWAELDRRSAVVFVHPTTSPGIRVLNGRPARSKITRLTRPSARSIWWPRERSPGFPPSKSFSRTGADFFHTPRLVLPSCWLPLEKHRSADTLLAEMKSFYFDTALAAPSGLPSLLAFAAPGRVYFGTDYPYASEKVSKTFTKNLDAYEHFQADDLLAINRGAKACFPGCVTAREAVIV